MKKLTVCLALLIAALVAAPAMAQHEGGGESGGSSGCGDVLGDLIEIQRDAVTGQPILAQRFVALKGGTYGWDYCPIALDRTTRQPLPFVALSCDPYDPTGTAVVPVDYFGRLSGGRTKERNSRMHFNEVISNIRMPDTQSVGLDETGRLRLGFGCTAPASEQCTEWATIDSPMENLALYTRLMKYGHFQTDPEEEDTSAHGDPATLPQYHPALTEADWAKFQPSVRNLLPLSLTTYAPELLTADDFVTAGAFLGGAANKTGKITVDLVQYMNRILKITKDTEISLSNADVLPAKVQDCWTGDDAIDPMSLDSNGDGTPDKDPAYLPPDQCAVENATSLLPRYLLSTAVQEKFVDFDAASYLRHEHLTTLVGPVQSGVWYQPGTDSARVWLEVPNVSVKSFLDLKNEPQPAALDGLAGFILASSDSLRSIEFVHNYAVPEDLGLDFVGDGYKISVKEK